VRVWVRVVTVSHGDREVAERNTIVRVLVGSQVHGTNVVGTDDRDEMGVCIEPKSYVLGLDTFEQWVYRTAEHKGSRSGPGDIDLTIYSLRRWTRLAAAGNPSMLALLFVPAEHAMIETCEGRRLRDAADLFVSRQAGHRFLGYLRAQRDKMLGERGNRTNRPELVERYGYDVKFAGHAVRLGHQGVEFLSTGRMTLPMAEPLRSWIVELRTGGHTMAEALEVIADSEAKLERLVGDPTIPKVANYAALSQLLVDLHESWWSR
jgi:uncharacterized protein